MPQKFKFKIENTMYEWDHGYHWREVRNVGPGIPDNMDVYLKVEGKPGRLVERNDSVDLGMPGIEKFYSQESSSTAG
jgi:hypothetical protein